MSKSEEYELVPIKPLKDMQAEFKKLKTELGKKKTSSPKEYTNILNAVSKIENRFGLTVKNLTKLTAKLDKIISIFSEDVGEEKEEVDRIGEILSRLESLEQAHNSLKEETKNLHSSIKRKSYFNERFPRGISVKYKRTKNL